MEIGAIVWGVKRLDLSIDFWTKALNYQLIRKDVDFAILKPSKGNGLQLSLNAAVTSEKPRRHHIDLFTSNQAEEVERLISIGATTVKWRYEAGADYVVLADPDGNPFCVVQV